MIEHTSFQRCDENNVELVDYYSNGRFIGRECSFHWWEASETSLHTHTFCEFFIISSGTTKHIINGEEQLLDRGTLYFIKAQDKHRFLPTDGSRCIHMNIAVGEGKLSVICSALGMELSSLLALDCVRMRLGEEELRFFITRARELNMLSRGEHTAPPEELIISEMLFEAVSLLCKNSAVAAQGAPPWFLELLRRLNSPEASGYSAARVCELAGYSAPALVGYFKRYTGRTIAGYLADVKVKTAKELLATTTLPILDISGKLGYDSLSHFNHLFKSRTGMTPGEYRKSRRG